MENVQNPEQYIAGVLERTQPRHIERTYDIKNYVDATDFLSILARKGGRLLKGGEADVDGVAKMVINDFLRGKIPWFTPPPTMVQGEQTTMEGREGRLGEMRGKRKREDIGSTAGDVDVAPSDGGEEDSLEDEFEGFEETDDGIDQGSQDNGEEGE